ncbi:universal stress protein [Haloglomus irregulare]|uniref:Universal stress protein n=1 Tax=Haloglomus irregulare TaxID=2234134 RepID=A0A554N8U1_9EURY|nr:universal stress protein [Haloglomus irregulare]TSD13759.1 universal stress protein [Haloglomus irregulare]
MKVLLGVGGSEDSLRALDRAIERARGAGDDLTVAVVDNPESPVDVDDVESEVRERLAATGFDAEVRRLEGDPGSRLVQLSEQEAFDRIVLGGGETSPLGKVRLGSIAEFVILNASVSVTLIR